MTDRYATPAAFKQAVEQRLRSTSTTGVDFARRRQLLVFERFLARVVRVFGDAAILKGGLVLELRLERARTTKDVDLRLVGSPDGVLARLQEAGRLDLGDFLNFEVQPDADHPEIKNEGMQYEGLRHRVEARLAGKIYGQPFGVDVAFADPILGEPDIVVPGIEAQRRRRDAREAEHVVRFQFRAEQTQDPTIAAIPVVVMTARGPLESGAINVAEILSKPLDVKKLRDAIHRAVRSGH